MLLWLQLLICLATIGYAGYFLSRYGDIIAKKTGMSASWVGLILLSIATSLPELVTGIFAVTFVNAHWGTGHGHRQPAGQQFIRYRHSVGG